MNVGGIGRIVAEYAVNAIIPLNIDVGVTCHADENHDRLQYHDDGSGNRHTQQRRPERVSHKPFFHYIRTSFPIKAELYLFFYQCAPRHFVKFLVLNVERNLTAFRTDCRLDGIGLEFPVVELEARPCDMTAFNHFGTAAYTFSHTLSNPFHDIVSLFPF